MSLEYRVRQADGTLDGFVYPTEREARDYIDMAFVNDDPLFENAAVVECEDTHWKVVA